MQKLHAAIQAQQSLITTAQAFADKYGPKMPEDFPGQLHFVYFDQGPEYLMRLPYGCYDREQGQANRERLLSAAGDVFGREGWTRHLSHTRLSYNWRKTCDGVRITLSEVESLEVPLEGSPVFPTAFPVLLADPATATV